MILTDGRSHISEARCGAPGEKRQAKTEAPCVKPHAFRPGWNFGEGQDGILATHGHRVAL